MKVFKLLTALLVLFFICQIFDISVYAQEVCKWDGGHHVCWGDVGCTVGLSTCSAPACHCYADSSPDGLYCGRVANCGQHCDFCPGTEGQSNCCWLEYCECGCACGGCCDGGAVPLCDAITYDLPSPLDPNTDICVSISREEAVPCGFGNWDNVELLVGPAGGTLFSVALGLCECDGSNCGQGYQGHFNTGPEGDYTMQFTVRNGMCQCNTYDFTVGSPPPPPPPPNLPPTCDIQSCPPPYMTTGEIFNITANANDTDGTVTRTLIHSIDQTASLPVPLPWNLECEDFSGSCNTDISFASPGDYYITCNAFDDGGGKCSGNPWCEWFPNPPSGMTCATDPVDDGQSGWSDCGNYDVCWVSVAEPKTWDIETEAICTNGEANTCSTRSWYRIWPPSPMQTTYRALISPGLDSFSITSEQHNNNIYVGMKDTAWNDLDLLGFPPHPGITYGTFWVGAIPMARWARDGVPEGGPYRIEFEAPEACCVSCNVSLNNITLEVGETDQYVPLNMTTSGPVFDRVEYTVVDGGVAAICDSALASCSEGSVSFTAGDSGLFQLTGITQGNTTYSALGYLVDGTECSSDTANISVMNVPWWQVGFGDVVTNDDIVSYIPSGTSTCLLPNCIDKLISGISGAAGEGAAIFSGAVELGSGDVSESGLLVDMEPSTIDVSDYDYDFFYNRAYDASNDTLTPSDVSTFDTSQLTSEGVDVTEAGNTYRVIVRNEETTINDGATVDIGDDKIILFVDNNLIIESAINLTKGQGFFMAIVSGNIIIDESVGDAYVPGNDDDTDPELEGIYVSTGGDINTGTYYDELTDTGADSDTTLEVRGVMAALTGRINMQRDLLDDSATPAEKFYYGPDQTLMVPQFFGQYVYRWKEVAP